MRRQCVVYTANAGYLFPALSSALQALESVDRVETDVIIICVGDTGPEHGAVDAVCKERGIRLKSFPESSIEGLHPMYARLFLSDMLEDSYDRALYVDSDTQIRGDIRPLFNAPLSPGRFMAARDPMCLVDDDFPFPAGILANFERVGLSEETRRAYFNSGMLVINMNGWRETSKDCRQRMATLDAPYKFPDQDILNIVGRDKVDLISMRWNFPAFLLRTVSDRTVNPRILHFMSRPRPWEGSFYPWGRSGMSPYREMMKRYPAMAPFRPRLSLPRYGKYHLQQIYKRIRERRLWDNPDVELRIKSLEESVRL